MQGGLAREKGVRPSVRLSVHLSNAWIVTKRKKNLFLWPSFLRKRMVGGGDFFYLKFWINNTKSPTGFRLIPTSMTLNDLEQRNSPYFAFVTEFDCLRQLRHDG